MTENKSNITTNKKDVILRGYVDIIRIMLRMGFVLGLNSENLKPYLSGIKQLIRRSAVRIGEDPDQFELEVENGLRNVKNGSIENED